MSLHGRCTIKQRRGRRCRSGGNEGGDGDHIETSWHKGPQAQFPLFENIAKLKRSVRGPQYSKVPVKYAPRIITFNFTQKMGIKIYLVPKIRDLQVFKILVFGYKFLVDVFS